MFPIYESPARWPNSALIFKLALVWVQEHEGYNGGSANLSTGLWRPVANRRAVVFGPTATREETRPC